jgi:hypothetical protein
MGVDNAIPYLDYRVFTPSATEFAPVIRVQVQLIGQTNGLLYFFAAIGGFEWLLAG